jgi:hypothetical protein
MSFSQTTIVPLGRLAAVHGVRKGEFPLQIKADLFSPGGTVLQDRLQLFLCRSDSQNWVEVTLPEAPKPMGGEWGKQNRVLLKFEKSIDILVEFLSVKLHLREYEFWMGVPRADLNRFLKPGEILAWDYLHCSFSESARPTKKGRVEKVLDPYVGVKTSVDNIQKSIVNLELLYDNDQVLVVPSSWISKFDLENKHIEFEDLSQWEATVLDDIE